MDKKKDTLLTEDIYTTIVDKMTKQIIEFKKQQGISIDQISVEKEVLNNLKSQIKKLKKEVNMSKKRLRSEKSELRRINDNLKVRNNILSDVNEEFLLSGESYIDLNQYSNLGLIENKSQNKF